MFTGIIEARGEVLSLAPVATGARLTLRVPFAADLATGESVAVNGACLTATGIDPAAGTVGFDLLAETLRVTNLGDLASGDAVNLERALAVGDRLSGHFVQGHVDCVSEILAWEPVGQDHRLEIALPPAMARYVIRKGSLCVDGISLTVADLAPDRMTLWIIPHTAAVTNLGTARAGKRVNLEFDMLAKYLERLMAPGA
ncbi:MAG: riboflavin synthase [Verrucomicrobiales bacterium]|nr:riboflavin synthase [Verrucomicrobiales bacterium]